MNDKFDETNVGELVVQFGRIIRGHAPAHEEARMWELVNALAITSAIALVGFGLRRDSMAGFLETLHGQIQLLIAAADSDDTRKPPLW